MNTQDILNIILILGIIIFMACSIVLTYFFIITLKAFKNMTEQIASTTESFKSGIGVKMLSMAPSIFVALISKFLKRGR